MAETAQMAEIAEETVTPEQFTKQMPDGRKLLSDEPEMESTLHYTQLALLVSCLEWFWRDRNDFFIGANLTVYYDHRELRQRRFRGPDFFFVQGVARQPRNSWVVWEEGGQYPHLIIELLSESTASMDRTEKKKLYENIFRTPEYFWFSPYSQEFQGFRLIGGYYQPIDIDDHGWRWSEVLGLYLGIADGQLRYFTGNGDKLPTPAEAAEQEIEHAAREQQLAEQERQRAEQAGQLAEQERQRAEQAGQLAEQERQRAEQAGQLAEQERQRAEKLAQRLRELGMDPDLEK